MTIQELEHNHFVIPDQAYLQSIKHTKISIEFAISVLEEFTTQYCECGRIDDNNGVEVKIQELKQYLDENK